MEPEITPVKVIKDPLTGVSEQRVVQKEIQSMLSSATKVAKKKADLDMIKIEQAMEFSNIARERGYDATGILDMLDRAIKLAERNNDTRALKGLIEQMIKLTMDVLPNIGDQVIKMNNTQINLEKARGKAGELSEQSALDRQKETLDVLKDFIKDVE